MGWGKAELSLTLVSDRAMARLNRETFGRRGPTNVIAFPVDVPGGEGQGPKAPAPSPQPPPPTPYRVKEYLERGGNGPPFTGPAGKLKPSVSSPPAILGEVVISVETTVRQARENSWPWEDLFDFFLIHGILHLLDYDHDTPEKAQTMDAKTWELMGVLSGGGG